MEESQRINELNAYENAYAAAFADAGAPLNNMERDIDALAANCQFAESSGASDLSEKCFDNIKIMREQLDQMRNWKSAQQFLSAFIRYTGVFHDEFLVNMNAISKGDKMMEAANKITVRGHRGNLKTVYDLIQRATKERKAIFIDNVKNIIDTSKVSHEDKELAYGYLQNYETDAERDWVKAFEPMEASPEDDSVILYNDIFKEGLKLSNSYTSVLR